ncbi:MAG: hypothetical protein L3J71_14640 [Victivallaceae bacterium]|nr:hypothetical protein [Victivallaceae bacterium]
MSFYLHDKVDYKQHNAEVEKLWRDYDENKHERVPVVIGGSVRNLISNPAINKTRFSFKDFFTKAEAQLECQLEYQLYQRQHMICDREMGLPKDKWTVGLDFQNSYCQAWYGGEFTFFDDEDVPDTKEIFHENPELIYQLDDLDPFWGIGDFVKKAMEMLTQMKKICDSGYEFNGRPVDIPLSFPLQSTGGLFTIATKLRGSVELMCDMYENPKYYHDLMDFVTRTTIARMKVHRDWAWDNDPDYKGDRKYKGAFNYADDSIALISPEQFKEFVLPYQKRLFDEFYDGRGCSIHLCGDATHHFKFLADEFNVRSFDTGFPVDHGKLRQELGPDIQINGGPTIMLVKDGTPEQIGAEVKRICESGVLEGKRFILIAANNLAPCTPVENLKALYEAGKKYGRF